MRESRVLHAILLLAILAAVWLLWSGIYQPLILGFGAFSCVLVVLVCARLRGVDAEGAPYHLVPRLLRYLPWFLLEVFKSNLDMTRRILSRRPATTPVMFFAPSTQRTPLGRAIYANSITLTPGTVTCMVEPGRFLVHAIATEVRDGVLTGEMDRRCTRLEGTA